MFYSFKLNFKYQNPKYSVYMVRCVRKLGTSTCVSSIHLKRSLFLVTKVHATHISALVQKCVYICVQLDMDKTYTVNT